MKKLSLIAVLIAASFSVVAGIKPQVVKFLEGETFAYSLSRYNYNRIAVVGEKITEVRFSSAAFALDTSKSDHPEENDGAVYIKPLQEMPMSIYFSTNKGHNFSIQAKQGDGAGQTIHFVSTKPRRFSHVAKREVHLTRNQKVMKDMVSGSTPKGFESFSPNEKPFKIKNKLELKLVSLLKGQGLTGFVYKVSNHTTKTQKLTRNLFANKKLKAISISEKSLKPNQTAYVFSLLSTLA